MVDVEQSGLGVGFCPVLGGKIRGFRTRKMAAKFGCSGLGFCVRCGTLILAVLVGVLGWLWGFWGGEDKPHVDF